MKHIPLPGVTFLFLIHIIAEHAMTDFEALYLCRDHAEAEDDRIGDDRAGLKCDRAGPAATPKSYRFAIARNCCPVL